MATLVRAFWANIESGSSVNPLDITTLVNLFHENASLPILTTVFGIIIFVSTLLLNAPEPISVRPFGKSTEAIELLPKAAPPIDKTVLGIFTVITPAL